MINVRAIANRRIQVVNKDIPAVFLRSTGYSTDISGHRSATYSQIPVRIQNQAATNDDLRQVDGLNLQGIIRTVSIAGDLQGTVRASNTGGDLLQFPDASGRVRQWLVTHVLETWPAWCRVLAVMQADSVEQYPTGSLLVDGSGLLIDGLGILFPESPFQDGSVLVDGAGLLVDGWNLLIADSAYPTIDGYGLLVDGMEILIPDSGKIPAGAVIMDNSALFIDTQNLIVT
jgi:hypothetical protein